MISWFYASGSCWGFKMLRGPKNNIRIADHFMLYEFECPCCKRVIIDFRLLDLLESLRERAGGRPVIVNSGYRCEEYNKKVGGVPRSYHLSGMAADIRIPGATPEEVLKHAYTTGFLGLGLYDTFCHLDIRYNLTRWRG
jgi:zinc D-Ala-D-Ala carboxypeptidase